MKASSPAHTRCLTRCLKSKSPRLCSSEEGDEEQEGDRWETTSKTTSETTSEMGSGERGLGGVPGIVEQLRASAVAGGGDPGGRSGDVRRFDRPGRTGVHNLGRRPRPQELVG